MKENISEIQLKLTESIESIEQQSKLKLYSQDNIARKSDRNSIDYEPAEYTSYYMRSLSSVIWIWLAH